jgi:hypothetical protein
MIFRTIFPRDILLNATASPPLFVAVSFLQLETVAGGTPGSRSHKAQSKKGADGIEKERGGPAGAVNVFKPTPKRVLEKRRQILYSNNMLDIYDANRRKKIIK